MDPQGWWGVLLQGTISAAVGGVVAALTAWGVVTVTHRHDQHTALRSEARGAAVRLFQLVGEYIQTLRRAVDDEHIPLPDTGSRDWLITATGAEIALYSFDQGLGANISQRIGEFRRALEVLAAGGLPRDGALRVAEERGQSLINDLADWLMEGRHRED